MANAQDSSVVCKNAANSTVTILTDSVCGSGFFIDDSIIVTNFYITKGAAKLYYCTNNSSVKYGIAGYIAVDKTFDLILLKVSGPSKPPVPIAASPTEVGQKVYAICGSNGMAANISEGTVSAKLGLNDDTLIQITATIPNKGSGGPVVNSTGELLGVSVIHHLNGQTIDISIPVKYIERLLKNRSDSAFPLSELNVRANTPVAAAKAYFRDGLQKYAYEDYKGALQDFSNAINLNPNDTDVYEFLGVAKALINDNLGAIKAFTRYLLVQPRSERVYYLRGALRRKIEDYAEAITDLDSVIKFDPAYAEAYLNRGMAEVAMKDYDDAEYDIRKAIELNPNYSDSYISNALIQEKVGHYRAAVQDYNTCLGENPEEFIVYFLRAYALNKLADYASAGEGSSMNDYRLGLLKCTTKDLNTGFYCGLAKYKLGDYKVALQYFTKAISEDQRYTYAYYYRALVYTIFNDYQSAIKDYNITTTLSPYFSRAWFKSGELKNKTGDSKGAVQDFSEAIKIQPKNGVYYYNRAMAEINLGDKKAGCLDLDKAKELGNADTGRLIKEVCK
jgi:tetratricopeptide (TPR) repeat protein